MGDYVDDDVFHFAIADPNTTNSLYESLSNNGLKPTVLMWIVQKQQPEWNKTSKQIYRLFLITSFRK